MKIYCLVASLLVLSGCSARPWRVKDSAAYSGTRSTEVYVVSHGWHTGLVVPSEKIFESLPELKQKFSQFAYIEFGWGDKDFYQAEEITSGLILRAIFWPTESVVHAAAVPENAEKYFRHSDVKKLCLNENEINSLGRFISNSFHRNKGGKVIAMKNGTDQDNQFYKGVGKYYLLNTCNKWTAKGLQSIGMSISPTFRLTAGSIIDYLNRETIAQTRAAASDSPLRCSLAGDSTDTTSLTPPKSMILR